MTAVVKINIGKANPYDEPVHIIEVQCGDYLGEDDIVRLEDNYGGDGTNT